MLFASAVFALGAASGTSRPTPAPVNEPTNEPTAAATAIVAASSANRHERGCAAGAPGALGSSFAASPYAASSSGGGGAGSASKKSSSMPPPASSFGDHTTGNLCSVEPPAAACGSSPGPLDGSLADGGCSLFSGFSARLPMFRILRLAVDPSLTNYG
jgi:hypothetical protein